MDIAVVRVRFGRAEFTVAEEFENLVSNMRFRLSAG
jgi:hypothetical protein